MSTYGVRLGDLMQDSLLAVLFAPVCQTRQTVDVAKQQVDGVLLVMDCDEEQARAIMQVCDMLAQRRRLRQRLRFYEQTKAGGAWKPIRPERTGV